MMTSLLAVHLLVLVLTFTQVAFGQTSKTTVSSAEKAQVLNVYRLLNEATLRNDFDTLERLIADDFRSLGTFGEVTGTKRSLLDMMKAGRMKSTFHKDKTLKVTIKGIWAVITGEAIERGTLNGQPFNFLARFSDVYEKRQGQWQNVQTRIKAIILQ
ncbi:MAG TPA: nuclear transport factor 2 family protein [Pyrinomonadaceae bacterium]|nr:nuclear transport factor 2 family protein [Pyrinomonadaceae bacterium]